MNEQMSEKIAGVLGADEYDGLKDWWEGDKYKGKRRGWLIGVCISLSLLILIISSCSNNPDVRNPNDGPPSTMVE